MTFNELRRIKDQLPSGSLKRFVTISVEIIMTTEKQSACITKKARKGELSKSMIQPF